MAQNVKDSFLDLERHRQLLEINIEKLQKSLRHWQTWEAEYEGLKEEILAAAPTPYRSHLVELARAYEGDLVTQKEIEDILGPASRTAAQVVTLLDHRIDYVEQNVRTVQKQFDAAENKLAAATVISTPDVRNEEGLPMTEIMEELDEDGNVIASHTSTPGSVKPQLLEVLKKAGVTDLPASSDKSAPEAVSTKANTVDKKPKVYKPSIPVPRPAKKAVQFADDTKAGPEPEKSQTAKRLEEIMRIAKASEESDETPIIPVDESADDAALRREMLQYGASEIGAVVAELDIEEGSDWSDEDDDDATDTDDEDQFGRSTNSVLDAEMRERMIELEERLGNRMIENIGHGANEPEFVKEGIGRIRINGKDANVASDNNQEATPSEQIAASPVTTKKSVRFSEDLDISPAVPAPQAEPIITNKKRASAPFSDIVERVAPAESINTSAPGKTSRFKSDRASASNILNGPLANPTNGTSLFLTPLKSSKPRPFSQPISYLPEEPTSLIAPSGPDGMTLAPTVVERASDPDASVTEPDALDPQLLHQEVATEYHRIRNRMIQKQGGFVQEEESETIPLTEEEGGPKKVSRFKAARLARS